MPMTISIMMMVIRQMFVVMGIESVMKTERTGFSRKMVVMGDDRVQHQQQIGRKQAKYDHLLFIHKPTKIGNLTL
jgi:hypothetical protein